MSGCRRWKFAPSCPRRRVGKLSKKELYEEERQRQASASAATA
ncbi:hypothetical protein ULF88_12095 [Halopseudomonas pachastrellae]|nr:hypothetical protein [Halopseudomonas pachastrellae]